VGRDLRAARLRSRPGARQAQHGERGLDEHKSGGNDELIWFVELDRVEHDELFRDQLGQRQPRHDEPVVMVVLADSDVEAIERFECFGGTCEVRVQGSGSAGSAQQAAALARRRLESWHRQFSRFDPESELSRINGDPRATVPVTAAMALFIKAAVVAATLTGGLVDPTLVGQLEDAGYTSDLPGEAPPLSETLRRAPARRPGAPGPRASWRQICLDASERTLTRPPGLRLDSGGIAKGLAGDVLAAALGGHPAFAIDAAGDVRFGGAAGLLRPIRIASPFHDSSVHTIELIRGAAATSGITRRCWLDHDGGPAHHLLDPATGRPAFTGILQVTALAPTGTQAEALSKAALLSGPDGAAQWLEHGGLIVYEDGSVEVVDPPTEELRS
jgi:thiamine biosynthesis lipoprotein